MSIKKFESFIGINEFQSDNYITKYQELQQIITNKFGLKFDIGEGVDGDEKQIYILEYTKVRGGKTIGEHGAFVTLRGDGSLTVGLHDWDDGANNADSYYHLDDINDPELISSINKTLGY